MMIKKVQGIFGETFILKLSTSAVFLLQNCVSNLFLFVSLGRFNRRDVYCPKRLGSRLKFQKTENGFADKRPLIKMTLICSCHWKILVPFCLRKKRPENTSFKLTVNCHKIIQKNYLCHQKQQ